MTLGGFLIQRFHLRLMGILKIVLTLIDRCRDISGQSRRDGSGRVLDTEVSPETNGRPEDMC